MKKWGILGLVILGALILGLQYYINRSEKTTGSPTRSGPEDQVGVALPPGATDYVMPQSFQNSDNTGTGNYETLSVPPAQSVYQGACAGASLAGIQSAHGKLWGYSVPKSNIAFDLKDNDLMYKFVGDYVECLAAARSDPGLCETLPTRYEATSLNSSPLPVKNRPGSSPALDCRIRTAKLMFDAYLAGKTTELSVCEGSRIFWDEPSREKIPLQAYCQAAAKGVESAREFIIKAEPEYPAEEVKAVYPVSKADCAGNPKCLFNFSAYSAIKSGKASACPPAPAGAPCAAFITRSADSCESIVKDMSKTYCATVARIQKKSGGFIGVSKNEMDGLIATQKAQKIADEERKKEDEKRLIEINKKAKQILGKE